MRAPAFWSNPPRRPGLLSRGLWPLSLLWQTGAWIRHWRARPVRAAVPVLCIGNLTAGGTGKTPMTIALMQRLMARGLVPHVVMRGHGGRLRGPHKVRPEDSFADVGDEAAMMAAYGPVWIARDRAAGIAAAAADGADLILMDDGMQNPGVLKDAIIVMIDAAAAFGNGRVIPAGPLREPVETGLARADLVVLVGDHASCIASCDAWPDIRAVTHVEATLVAQQTGWPLDGENVVAFAGIGRPQKFFDTLTGLGARLLEAHAFGDHEVYTPQILRRLTRRAQSLGAALVTTEKDAVRLPLDVRREVITVQVTLEPADWEPLDTLVSKILTGRKSS